MMTCMRARRSWNFCQIRLLTAEYAALERLQKPHGLIIGKFEHLKINVAPFSCFTVALYLGNSQVSVCRTIGPLVELIIVCFVVAICDLVHAVEAIYCLP